VVRGLSGRGLRQGGASSGNRGKTEKKIKPRRASHGYRGGVKKLDFAEGSLRGEGTEGIKESAEKRESWALKGSGAEKRVGRKKEPGRIIKKRVSYRRGGR